MKPDIPNSLSATRVLNCCGAQASACAPARKARGNGLLEGRGAVKEAAKNKLRCRCATAGNNTSGATFGANTTEHSGCDEAACVSEP